MRTFLLAVLVPVGIGVLANIALRAFLTGFQSNLIACTLVAPLTIGFMIWLLRPNKR